jgi:predicted DNA-binding transcriptional regulator AlpA
MNNGAQRHYRVKQVAELLTVSVREAWRLVARGELPPPVKIGRCSMWFESDMVKFQMQLRAQRERRAA